MREVVARDVEQDISSPSTPDTHVKTRSSISSVCRLGVGDGTGSVEEDGNGEEPKRRQGRHFAYGFRIFMAGVSETDMRGIIWELIVERGNYADKIAIVDLSVW